MIIKYDRVEFMASGKSFNQFLKDKYGEGKPTVLFEDENQDSLVILIEPPKEEE